MKIILLSDCHCCVDKPVGRIDNINMLDLSIAKLEYVFQYAYENKINAILQAGDLLDVKRNWQLLSVLSKFLEKWKNKNILMYNVGGNHDQYFHNTTNESTILGVLVTSGLTIRLNNIPIAIENVNIYGTSWGEEIPKVISDVVTNILVIHKSILIKKQWSQQEDFEYAPDFLKQHKYFDLILTGDSHQKFEYKIGKRIICNTGVMMRLESTEDNISHQPGFYVFDTDKENITWIENKIAQNGNEILSTAHLMRKKESDRSFEEFINKVKATEGDSKSLSFSRNLKLFMKRNETSDDVRELISEYMSKVEDK